MRSAGKRKLFSLAFPCIFRYEWDEVSSFKKSKSGQSPERIRCRRKRTTTKKKEKMSAGTLYANFRARTLVPKALVKYLGLDITLVTPEDNAEQFARDFPWKKVPAYISPKGVKLTEHLAVIYYLLQLSDNEKLKVQLMGDDSMTQAQILRWESLANSDLISQMANAFKPLKGETPYIKKNVDAALENVAVLTKLYEERLQEHTYLVGERITLADLVSAAMFSKGFATIFGAEWRKEHPAIVRWFSTVIASDIWGDEFKDFKFIEKPLAPPQKEKKQKPAAAAAPAAPKKEEKKQKPAAEEAEPKPEKKPKHPLELLGKPTFVLDEWKRKYSNEDTRPVALPWFWDHFNAEEYSLWKVEYKYNDELTLTFMSNNLIGGFFNRLSASVRYMFGCLVVYGENNNNGIIGAIMVRGQEFQPAFDVAPDWESYSYTKLDPTSKKDREFVDDMWAWDKPVEINGEKREIVDGKVLK